jgi:hypothetical protein
MRIRLPIDRGILSRLRDVGNVDVLLETVAPLWIHATHGDGYNPARPHVRIDVPFDVYREWADSRVDGPKAYHNLNGLLDKVDRVVRRARRSDTGAGVRLEEVVEVLKGRGDVEVRIRLSALLLG